MMTQQRSETHSTSLCLYGLICQYDTICPTGNQQFTIQSDMSREQLFHIGAVQQLARLHALRYDLSFC